MVETSVLASLNTQMKEELKVDIKMVKEEVEDIGVKLEVLLELSNTLYSLNGRYSTYFLLGFCVLGVVFGVTIQFFLKEKIVNVLI